MAVRTNRWIERLPYPFHLVRSDHSPIPSVRSSKFEIPTIDQSLNIKNTQSEIALIMKTSIPRCQNEMCIPSMKSELMLTRETTILAQTYAQINSEYSQTTKTDDRMIFLTFILPLESRTILLVFSS
jgi:hypothetical protein